MAYRLTLPTELGRLHDVFHASLLKPHHGSVPYRDEPVVVDSAAGAEPEYEVEAILKQRQRRQNRRHWVEYLVKWKGYPVHEATWETTDALEHAQTALRTFLSGTTSN